MIPPSVNKSSLGPGPSSSGPAGSRGHAPLDEPDSLRLSALVDANPEAVAILDAEWRYVYINLAYERLTRSSDAVIGQCLWDLYPQLLGTAFERQLREVMKHRHTATLVFHSSNMILDVRAMPFGDGLAFFARDASELHRANEELRQKEERFRAILNTEPGCVILVDRDGKVLDTNPAGLELLEVDGYDALLGNSIVSFIAPPDREALKALIANVFDGGTASLTFGIVGSRGTQRRVEHRAVPLRNAEGVIVAALSITTDVTERYEVEATLRQRTQQHAILARLGALALRNANVDEITSRAVADIGDALRVPERVALDLLRRHGLSDAGARDEEASAGITLEAEDADFVRSAALLLTSARERRRAEDALLEREEQLRQAQKMEAIGQLAGGVAHDFNNLLTVINVHTDLLLRALSSADAMRGDVEEIARAAARAASLTRQLLTFSRKQVVQPQVLDLARVVSGVEPMLRRLIGEDVDFETCVFPPIDPVVADEGEIEQVLINLVINARDAMPQGGRLTVEITNAVVDDALCVRHPSLRPGESVRLTVSDTGTGMTAETMARAFEPFFTTKERGRGTGLGLSTVYGIVKQSGGAITVDSEPGAGTTFCVYLPVAQAMDHQPAGIVERRAPTAADETVLLVEDEDSVRKLARRVLETQGYTVLEAINGEDALRIASDYAGVIDLLLSDVVMPELGGRMLAERLTASRPDTEVLFMSGYTDDDILRRGLLERGQRLIQKPFTAATLAHEVRSVLDAKRHRRSSVSRADE
ncbi:MAG TPA: PAS domain-containing protein [Gemmatimonadaceae bacterium]|nr:PAS domain-containing protein [Gemmatimonadaceae bacterium]